MPAIKQALISTRNFTVGRNGQVAKLIVLHEVNMQMEMADAEARLSDKRNMAGMTGSDKHISFHYVVSDSIVHQYVDINDTSHAFGPNWQIDDWLQSLVLVSQGVDPDFYTINIGVVTGSVQVNTYASEEYTSEFTGETMNTLKSLVCELCNALGIVSDKDTVVLHGQELFGLDIESLFCCE